MTGPWEFHQQCPTCKRVENYAVPDKSYAWTKMCPACGCESCGVVKCRWISIPGVFWNPWTWFDFKWEVAE